MNAPIILSKHASHKLFKPWPKFNKIIVIRFGAIKDYPHDIELQKTAAILKSTNKLQMKKIFALNNIPSPKFDIIPWNGCVMKRLNHSRGNGMKIITHARRTRPALNHYYEEYIPCKKEFRVHVFNNKAFFADEKILKEGHQESWIKNHKHNYFFQWIRLRELDKQLKEDAQKAVTCLGLLFGAVDIGITNENKHIIFETNAAPGLRTRTRKRYQKQIIDYLQNNYNLEMGPPEDE